MANRTALVVEDTEELRETVALVLRERGFEVATVNDGLEALEYLAEAPTPDLIVLDLMLPRMTGWEFVERVSEFHRLAPVPIIVMSASAFGRGTRRQFKFFLAKPFQMEELEHAVQEATSPPAC